MRVLVTGSRDWDDWEAVWRQLDALCPAPGHTLIVVHGACPTGADHHASDWCDEFAWFAEQRGAELIVEPHAADWAKHGKAAGPIRNQQMVDVGADLCLAFVKNNSRGASDCLARAQAAGIECRVFRA